MLTPLESSLRRTLDSNLVTWVWRRATNHNCKFSLNPSHSNVTHCLSRMHSMRVRVRVLVLALVLELPHRTAFVLL